MKVFLLSCVFLLAACSGLGLNDKTSRGMGPGWPMGQLENPPAIAAGITSPNDPEFQRYIADMNAYAYYVFIYTRNLNDYAHAHGWKVPQVISICERFDIGELHPVPAWITLDADSRSPQAISRDLAAQLKRILSNYRADRSLFLKAKERHEETCIK